MNTLFESRATIYWSVMDEYNRHFFLKSPACIVRYIIGFLAICLAVFDVILMKNRPDADMNIVFVVCFAVIAVLFSVMGIIRYFSLKKTGARRDAEISHREVIARVTEDGVVSTSETGDESSVSFSEIKLLYIGETTLFVQTKSSLVHIFPKDSFTVVDAAGMVEFFKKKRIKIK